jgi:hypothetical protein
MSVQSLILHVKDSKHGQIHLHFVIVHVLGNANQLQIALEQDVNKKKKNIKTKIATFPEGKCSALFTSFHSSVTFLPRRSLCVGKKG